MSKSVKVVCSSFQFDGESEYCRHCNDTERDHINGRAGYDAVLAPNEDTRIAIAIVTERLKGLHLLDFGGLVACGTNRVQAEKLLLNLLFPGMKY